MSCNFHMCHLCPEASTEDRCLPNKFDSFMRFWVSKNYALKHRLCTIWTHDPTVTSSLNREGGGGWAEIPLSSLIGTFVGIVSSDLFLWTLCSTALLGNILNYSLKFFSRAMDHCGSESSSFNTIPPLIIFNLLSWDIDMALSLSVCLPICPATMLNYKFWCV